MLTHNPPSILLKLFAAAKVHNFCESNLFYMGNYLISITFSQMAHAMVPSGCVATA